MTENSGMGGQLGGKLGGRWVDLASKATVATRQRMAPVTAGIAQKVLQDFTNHVSDELRGAMGPIMARFADDPATPEELRPVFKRLAHDRGQAWAWVLGTATGTVMGGGLMSYINNALAPMTNAAIAATPNLVFSPGDNAAMVAKRISTMGYGANEAAKQGINREKFERLVAVNQLVATLSELLDQINRGLISVATARTRMARAGYDAIQIDELLELRHQNLSPEILAQMWNRDIVSTTEGRQLAARSGVGAKDFDRLTLLGGEPPAVQDVLLAWRRGVIDEGRVDRALIQGPLRKEWIDVIKALQWQPLPLSEAADAVNQGHMTLPAAQRVAREQGVRPDDFAIIVNNAGLPPGVEFAQEAWNRGFIGQGEFRTMFLESRLKNRYLPLLEAMRVRLIPQETARLLYRNGVYSRQQAMDTLLKHGFSKEDAAALLALEETRNTDETRTLTQAQIRSLYTDRAITRTAAAGMLTSVGYAATEVDLLLTLSDIDRDQRFVNAVITRLRSGYVAYRLSESEVSTALDALRVPPDQRDDLVALWDLERTVVTKGLTVAEIKAALRKGLIDEAGARSRLLALGYAPEDVDIQIRLTTPAG